MTTDSDKVPLPRGPRRLPGGGSPLAVYPATTKAGGSRLVSRIRTGFVYHSRSHSGAWHTVGQLAERADTPTEQRPGPPLSRYPLPYARDRSLNPKPAIRQLRRSTPACTTTTAPTPHPRCRISPHPSADHPGFVRPGVHGFTRRATSPPGYHGKLARSSRYAVSMRQDQRRRTRPGRRTPGFPHLSQLSRWRNSLRVAAGAIVQVAQALPAGQSGPVNSPTESPAPMRSLRHMTRAISATAKACGWVLLAHWLCRSDLHSHPNKLEALTVDKPIALLDRSQVFRRIDQLVGSPHRALQRASARGCWPGTVRHKLCRALRRSPM